MTRVTAILDSAEARIRTHGYHGFSFREVATDCGIKSASVHYHFPTKADLAAAVARRYRERFAALLDEAISAGVDPLEAWRALFREAFTEDGRMCLCGILGVEGDALPPPVAEEARQFFEDAVRAIGGDDRQRGLGVLARLEGAMLLARTWGSVEVFDAATERLA